MPWERSQRTLHAVNKKNRRHLESVVEGTGSREDAIPNIHGGQLSADAVQYLLAKYAVIAKQRCPSLRQKRVTPHCLRHSSAMKLLQAGLDTSVIGLWLGHE